MMLYRTSFDSPVGPLLALASDTGLCALEFFTKGRTVRLDARLARWFDGPDIVDDNAQEILKQTQRWLDAYFAGTSADISDVPLDMRGATFERRVWDELKRIPPGSTTTYGAVAKQVGAPGAARAVGMANGANPVAIIVPCHRVIGSNGTLTGYGGGLDQKTWLLDHERRWSTTPENLRFEFGIRH
jgi:methylated-DNA-[protein]-cysteine S-methyltransferase